MGFNLFCRIFINCLFAVYLHAIKVEASGVCFKLLVVSSLQLLGSIL